MAFEGCEFSFDGISSREHGLVMYSFGSYAQDSTFSYPSAGKMIKERIPNHNSSFLYTVSFENEAEFTMVFGVAPESMDERDPLDRWELEVISSWLTGHKTYKWLEIDQDDMNAFRYRCLISKLEVISLGGEQWAYKCQVTCDSPYGYTYPEITSIPVSGEDKYIVFNNKSTSNEDYYPLLNIEMNGESSISVVNEDFNNEGPMLTDLPGQTYNIKIDNDNQIIMSDELDDFNFYDGHFNFEFLRLKRGENNLKLSGNGIIKFICSYPVNIGG